MADRPRNTPDVARYAHQRPDGSILYIESNGKVASDGTLPPGTEPGELEAQGFVFLDEDAYARTQRSLDPIARAEDADADALSVAFDASMSERSNDSRTPTRGEQMDGMEEITPEMLEMLQAMMDDGSLAEFFTPYQQQQGVLDQQMAIAGQARQPGGERSTPTGALLGGLSNAIGNIAGAHMQQKALEGQTNLGKRMQGEAASRVGRGLKAMKGRRRGTVADVDPDMSPGAQLLEVLGDQYLE
jgi:hypothetical protein